MAIVGPNVIAIAQTEIAIILIPKQMQCTCVIFRSTNSQSISVLSKYQEIRPLHSCMVYIFFRLYDEWFHWTRFSTNFARPIKENNATTVRNKLWIKLHLNSRLNIQLHNPFVCWKRKTYILSVYLKITKMIPIKMLDVGQFGRSGRIFPAKFISNK